METGGATASGGARVLVAADGARPESEGAAEDIGPELEEVAAVDVVDPLVSVDFDVLLAADNMALNSQEPDEGGVVEDSQMPPDSVTPELLSVELLLSVDSDVLLAADSVALNSMEVVEGSEVADSQMPGAFVCGRCGLVHEDREAWNRAHSRFYPCPSCGLVHAEIAFDVLFGRIKVDCERFMEHYPGWI